MKIKASFAETNNSLGAKLTSANESLSADFGEVQVVPGADGFSPTVDIEPIDGGHRISITDKDGTQTADVLDGRDGKDGADGYTPVKGVDYFDGQPGEKGDPGDPGADGISPTVAVQDITGGHRVTISDKNGAKTFDVMDGKDGAGGSGGASVQSDWSVNDENDPAYVKNRTHWVERPYEPIVWDGSIEGRDSVDLSLAMGYPAGSVIVYKISDHVLTLEEIEQSTAYTTQGIISESAVLQEPEILVEGAIWMTGYGTFTEDEFGSMVDFTGGTIICTAIEGDFTDVIGVVIPSVGTYAIQDLNAGVGLHTVEINADTYHAIDNRYLRGLPAVALSGDYKDVLNAPFEWQTGAAGVGGIKYGINCASGGAYSISGGFDASASGEAAVALGIAAIAIGDGSFATGSHNTADFDNQFVCGKNCAKSKNPLAFVVGNGAAAYKPSNAHTLDWDGNAWYSGSVYVGSTSGVNRDEGSRKLVANGDSEIILTSPSGTRYRLTVADDGTLTTAAM